MAHKQMMFKAAALEKLLRRVPIGGRDQDHSRRDIEIGADTEEMGRAHRLQRRRPALPLTEIGKFSKPALQRLEIGALVRSEALRVGAAIADVWLDRETQGRK